MQCFATHRSEPILGAGPAPLEGLGPVDVTGFFQLAGMSAPVTVTDLEQGFQLIERKVLVDGERTHDP